MRFFILIPLLVAYSAIGIAQVYYPLHIGDYWGYEDNSSLLCEGTSLIVHILGDTLLGGKHYYRINAGLPIPGPFVRADSMRVYEFDTTSRAEYVDFDFGAKPGDTVSVRNNGAKVIIALGNLQFSVLQVVVTIRDSVGVVGWHDYATMCDFHLRSAWIGGHLVSVTERLTSSPLPRFPYMESSYPNPFNPSTSFRFFTPEDRYSAVAIFDGLGRHVSTLYGGRLSAGWHTFVWDAKDYTSGIYYCRISSEGHVLTQRLVLLK